MSDIRFLIICPAAKEFRITGRQRPSFLMRAFRFSMLSPLYVAAAAPPGVTCRIIDENVEAVNFAAEADLVGISFMTFNAGRAYEIASEFQRRGKTVIFGGHHPTLLPTEAIEHANAICLGDAEPNLPRMITDFRRGQLQGFYSQTDTEFRGRKLDPKLIQRQHYGMSNVVQATRGCVNHCEFCSISAFSGRKLRTRPVAEVIEEIRAFPGRYFLFIDDNLTANVAYAKRLFKALAPLKKRWYAQSGIHVAADPELLHWMAASGCRGVFVGFESLRQECLDETGKQLNRAAVYCEAIQKLHRHGICVMGAFVFGFDHDPPEIFAETSRFLVQARVDCLQVTVLTPFPGTPLFEKLRGSRRLFDINWEHYDMGRVLFTPKNMTVEELQAGHDRVVREFYSWPAILARLGRQVSYLGWREVLVSLGMSLAYRFKMSKTSP